ncbi:unnamed protein product [Orchesella dallaii]|uniref:Gustatory receptor n=1 Tax=Orchesella dallaii TaxID=48710 RepID=A0ABP1R6J2_9HEXA
MTTVTVMLLFNQNEWIDGFNQLYSADVKMANKYEPDNLPGNTKGDAWGFCACALVIGFMVGSPFMNVIVIFERLDSLAYLLDDHLPPAEYRQLSTIIITILFRYGFSLPAIIELNRILSFLLLNGSVLMDSLMACLRVMAHKVENSEEFLRYYLPHKLAYRHMESAINDLTLVMATSSYWILVAALWTCVRGFGHLEAWMHLGIATFTAIDLLLNWVTLNNLKAGRVIMINMIEKWETEAQQKYMLQKTRKSKAVLKAIGAASHIKISCGGFFVLDSEFIVTFFYNLLQREVDTLLTFQL